MESWALGSLTRVQSEPARALQPSEGGRQDGSRARSASARSLWAEASVSHQVSLAEACSRALMT